jgi:hypothetical protein
MATTMTLCHGKNRIIVTCPDCKAVIWESPEDCHESIVAAVAEHKKKTACVGGVFINREKAS